MDEILTTLNWVLSELENKSVVLSLKGPPDNVTGLLETLTEGKTLVRSARACLKQSQSLLQKGYGKLVGPEEG